MNNEDQKDIDECLAGQTDAFSRLVVRYQDRLYRSLVLMLGSAEDAQDIAQEAFILSFKKLDTFRGHSAFYSWLFRIAMNAAISMKRKQKLRTTSIQAAQEESGLEPVDQSLDSQPDFQMNQQEQQELVLSALQELPDEYRTVLILKEMEGMKYEDIAEVIDSPIGTVRSRIHRARSELRENLRFLLDFQSDTAS